MYATPNQHLLTLPSSPVGKSSDFHAGLQQFRAQVFFFYTHILSGSCSQPYFGQLFYLVCRYLEKKKKESVDSTSRDGPERVILHLGSPLLCSETVVYIHSNAENGILLSSSSFLDNFSEVQLP